MKFEIKYNNTNPDIAEEIVLESLRQVNKALVNSAIKNNFGSKSYRMTIHAHNYSWSKSFAATIYLKYSINYNISVQLNIHKGVVKLSGIGAPGEFLIADPDIYNKIIGWFKTGLRIS